MRFANLTDAKNFINKYHTMFADTSVENTFEILEQIKAVIERNPAVTAVTVKAKLIDGPETFICIGRDTDNFWNVRENTTGDFE